MLTPSRGGASVAVTRNVTNYLVHQCGDVGLNYSGHIGENNSDPDFSLRTGVDQTFAGPSLKEPPGMLYRSVSTKVSTARQLSVSSTASPQMDGHVLG